MGKVKLFSLVVMITVISLWLPAGEFNNLCFLCTQAEAAQQADGLVKEINKELRIAERNMFKGKNELADQQLEGIAIKLDDLKKLDPHHKKIKTLVSKYNRTKKTIDKKMGRSIKASSKEIRGLADKPEVKPVNSNKEIRGLAKKPEVKPVVPNQKIRGLAKKTEATKSTPSISTHKMPAFDKKRALLAKRRQQSAGDPAVQADIDKIIEFYDVNYTKFYGIDGNNLAVWVTGSGIEEAKKALARLNQAEQDFDGISSDIGRLAESYNGTNLVDISALSSNIYNSIREKLKANPKGSPGNKLAALIIIGMNISETRKATCEHLVAAANQSINAWENQMTDAQLERLHNAKELLVVALQIDPRNEKAKNFLAEMDIKIANFADKMNKTIDKNVWNSSITDFSGPGTVKQLVASATTYFEKDRDWGGREKNKLKILAVSVTGPWSVGERDVFGRVIRWRLPVNVAITDKKLKSRNIAMVYDLSIVAMQGRPNHAPQKPPWDGFWVGNSYMMRLNKF